MGRTQPPQCGGIQTATPLPVSFLLVRLFITSLQHTSKRKRDFLFNYVFEIFVCSYSYMTKNFILSVGILAGTIIGAGIFSLPYVFRTVGVFNGLIYLAVFSVVYFFIHLMYAQIIERHRHEHQFFYYAQEYLPRWLSGIASYAILGELILALTVYLILAPVFGTLIFNGIDPLVLMIVFWIFSSLFIFAKLSVISWSEFLGIIGVAGIIGIVLFYGGFLGNAFETDFIKPPAWQTFFLPFGPLLFSLAGRPAIPKVVEEYTKARQVFSLSRAIAFGTFIPAIIYAIFVFAVLRLAPDVSSQTIDSLSFLPPVLLVLIGVMGIITLWTSYFILGINVRDILTVDLKVRKIVSTMIVFFLPIILYFLGFQQFLEVVSLSGGVFLGLEGIFVVMMWRKAFPNVSWRWISWMLYPIFGTAIVYGMFYFFFMSS